MFRPDRAIFRELCTVKSNLKNKCGIYKILWSMSSRKKVKCYITVIEETLDPVLTFVRDDIDHNIL
jgi:hypothetical protein